MTDQLSILISTSELQIQQHIQGVVERRSRHHCVVEPQARHHGVVKPRAARHHGVVEPRAARHHGVVKPRAARHHGVVEAKTQHQPHQKRVTESESSSQMTLRHSQMTLRHSQGVTRHLAQFVWRQSFGHTL